MIWRESETELHLVILQYHEAAVQQAAALLQPRGPPLRNDRGRGQQEGMQRSALTASLSLPLSCSFVFLTFFLSHSLTHIAAMDRPLAKHPHRHLRLDHEVQRAQLASQVRP